MPKEADLLIMKFKGFLTIMLALTALLALNGCGDTKKSSDVPKEQELRICSSLGKNMTELLVNDFVEQNKGKIKADITYIPGGSTEERLRFIAQGRFDCWLGGTPEEYFTANQDKLLEAYATKEAFKLPVELRNRRNLGTNLYLSHVAIISNKNKLHNLGIYAPTTWKELLAPQYKNEIVVPNYNLGGSSFGMITSIWQLHSKDAALKYAASFNKQNPQYTNNLLEAADLVYKGQKTSAILPMDYAMELEEKHPHLFATVPKDANRNLITGIALLNKAPNVPCAQQFIDHLMSDASKDLLLKNQYQYIWHIKDYHNTASRVQLTGKLAIPIDDLAWTSTYKSEIIRQWLEAK